MTDEPHHSSPAEIVVYWRPGCGFCTRLIRRLDAMEVPHRLVNIWDDPDAAAVVRSIARGNETVPTVVVGPEAMVNPHVDQVIEAAARHVPTAVPVGY